MFLSSILAAAAPASSDTSAGYATTPDHARARTAALVLLGRMAAADGADCILVGVTLAHEPVGHRELDLATGFVGRDKVHIDFDPSASMPLLFDCGFGLSWMTVWECGYRPCLASDGRLLLVPIDPQVGRHITIEDGRLMIADWPAMTDAAEYRVGCERADALVRQLLAEA